jgi:hypothetical protein
MDSQVQSLGVVYAPAAYRQRHTAWNRAPSLILLAAFVFRVQLERPLQITEPLIPIKVN